jgi:RNA polymerase sigma factor (sigma-70 family)
MTDQKAIEGCKKQDRISQKYLFDKYSDGMLMVCMRYVKQLQDAEEIMLNGFFNFYKSIDRFMYNGDRSIAAWLKKIMVNECLMFLRKKGALKITEEKEGMAVSVEDGTMGQMNANEMFKLIMTLPDGYRTVFNLFVVEGYGHKEIADVLGITEGTSKSQLAKARTMLQKMLGRPVKGNQRP